MKTLTKKVPSKKSSKKVDYISLAGLWAELRKKEEALTKERRAIAKPIIAALKANGVVDVQTDLGLVRFISDKRKSPTKKDVVAYFGASKGEKFWKGVPEKTLEYLTLVVEDAKKEE